jgi:carboxyl-terminal processing protease
MIRTYFIGLILLLTGCEKLFIKPPANSQKEIFKTIWKNYDMYFSRFEIYSINWDSVYNYYEPKVQNDMSDKDLFNLMCQMLNNLKGGHVWLISPSEFYQVPSGKNYNYYYNASIVSNYLQSTNKKYMFTYGKLTDRIGYINISTFFTDEPGYEYIDNILNEFNTCNGIVIDLRNNMGGDNNKAKIVAARFCDTEKAYAYFKIRNGENHNDFSKETYMYIKPNNNKGVQKKIMLLTDNHTGSSGEDFTLMMKALPNVTQIGDSTASSFGSSPIMIKLQNGWMCYVPNSLQYTLNGTLLLDKGIAPDYLITVKKPERDLMIEKAIELLE